MILPNSFILNNKYGKHKSKNIPHRIIINFNEKKTKYNLLLDSVLN